MNAKQLKQQLGEAYDLIQRDELDEAIEIINPILKAHPDNADAWWLLANAESEPTTVRQALVNVLKIRPRDERARDMLEKLNEAFPPRTPEDYKLLEQVLDTGDHDFPAAPARKSSPSDFFDFEQELDDPFADSTTAKSERKSIFDEEEDFDWGDEKAEISVAQSNTQTKAAVKVEDDFPSDDDILPDIDEDADPFAALLEDAEKPAKRRRERAVVAEEASAPRRNRTRLLLVAVVVIALVGVLFVLTQSGDEKEEAVSPDTKNLPDVPALVRNDTVEQENATLLVSANEEISASAFSFSPESTVLISTTEAGNTLFVDTCTCLSVECEGPGSETLFDLTFESMRIAAATIVNNAPANIQAYGVNVRACGNGPVDTVYRAFAPADGLDSGLIDNQNEFITRWTVIEG